MVDAVVLEAVEPVEYTSPPSRPSHMIVSKPIQKFFRPWVSQKFTSLSQVRAFAQVSELSYYRCGDAMYVVMNDEWFIFIHMHGHIWSRPAIRVQEPTLDVQLLAPIGHNTCEHCGKVDVLSKYVTLVCSGISYMICKEHLKSNALDYVRKKYRIQILSD